MYRDRRGLDRVAGVQPCKRRLHGRGNHGAGQADRGLGFYRRMLGILGADESHRLDRHSAQAEKGGAEMTERLRANGAQIRKRLRI